MKDKWQVVVPNKITKDDDDVFDETRRLRVPGGWVYSREVNEKTKADDFRLAVAVCFVPDAEAQ